MLVHLKSKIKSLTREKDWVLVSLDFNGQVQDTKLINAKDAHMEVTLKLKPAIVDQLKVGSTFVVTLSTEETENDI